MTAYTLVNSTTKEPIGKLPAMVPNGKPYKILRFVEPCANKRPSGELVLLHTTDGQLMRSAPPVFNMMLVPRV
jgi:hypothetical protein